MEEPHGNRTNMEGVNLKGANLEGSQMAGVNLRYVPSILSIDCNLFELKICLSQGLPL